MRDGCCSQRKALLGVFIGCIWVPNREHHPLGYEIFYIIFREFFWCYRHHDWEKLCITSYNFQLASWGILNQMLTMNPLFSGWNKWSFKVNPNDTATKSIFLCPLLDNLQCLLSVFEDWGDQWRKESGCTMLLAHPVHLLQCLKWYILIKLCAPAPVHL